MQNKKAFILPFMLSVLALMLSGCYQRGAMSQQSASNATSTQTVSTNYASRIPLHINTREKVVVIDPNAHVWGAYDSSGNLVRAGLATAGGSWCPDINRSCRTKSGSFRVYSLGSASCKSSKYPLPKGGAPMPYCMYFNGGQGLHGSNAVFEGNGSHGCVRLRVSDAEWLRFNFVNVGTRVVVKPY